ncbi:hypothetical protein GR927_28380 [Mycolicibacterium sp. 3033]|nr:hypothetical protein [Mycolicibacterium aurantiacum]
MKQLVMNELFDLICEAQKYGWSSSSTVSLDRLTQQARLSRIAVVPDRKSGPDVSVLEPTDMSEAPERSLSAIYGTGTQPLHTDGAHHIEPPDIILLSSATVSTVPTLLWHFRPHVDAGELVHDLHNGLFTVRAGKHSFLAPALDSGHVRYDPGCMDPADGRAQRVADFFVSKLEAAVPFSWETPGLTLAIANRRVLHAREDASNETERQLQRVALRVRGLPSRASTTSSFSIK